MPVGVAVLVDIVTAAKFAIAYAAVVATEADMPPQPGVLRPLDDVNDSPMEGWVKLVVGMHVRDLAIDTVDPPVSADAVSVVACTVVILLPPPPGPPNGVVVVVAVPDVHDGTPAPPPYHPPPPPAPPPIPLFTVLVYPSCPADQPGLPGAELAKGVTDPLAQLIVEYPIPAPPPTEFTGAVPT